MTDIESPKREHIPDLAERDTCPNPECGKSWIGEPIPETHREHFGGSTHFRRCIAIYDRDKDRTVAWRCPDCEMEWER